MGSGLWPVLGYGYWSFIERQTGAFLGNGGLAQFERGVAALESHVEAGWAFVPAAWGKGYATEAMAAVLEWADTVLNIIEIRAIIDHDNLASARVAEKLGFTCLMPIIPELPEAALWQRRKA
jgi:RimJ/RimL family protein N-acetyltransferase